MEAKMEEHLWRICNIFPFPAYEYMLVPSMQMASDPGSQEASSGAQGFQCTTNGAN